jgi:GH24 family phage-related lysozyme (muramidase)
MTKSLLPKVISNLAKHEGRKARMYPDTVGVVTVGVGHAIFNPQQALALHFSELGYLNARPSTILADYAMVKNHLIKVGNLILSEAAQDAVLAEDLKVTEKRLLEALPAALSFPETAQIALFDLVFNCGELTEQKWPHFLAAVRAGDWKGAAAHCNRPQVSVTRNADTKEQLLDAA